MKTVSNLTTDEMKEVIERSKRGEEIPAEIGGANWTPAADPDLDTPMMSSTESVSNHQRNLLLVGCGDGGCNIAVTIMQKMPNNARCVLYNTSARAMEKHRHENVQIVLPAAEDGSGKDRSYSKDVFKRGSYKELIEKVNMELSARKTDYIIVTTTADGGTGGGVSPNVAKFLDSNTEVPVIIVGVLPSLTEDAKAQYNALAWQADVEKTGLPHIVFDNNGDYASKLAMHTKVNAAIASAMEVISGTAYGDTLISSIDNRDMLMILVNGGNRIVVETTTNKPRVTESFDDFIMTMLNESHQPMPKNAKAIGIFVKGPKAFIESVDASLLDARAKIGNGQMFSHIEESDDVRISIVAAGCTAYDERMYTMRQRYEDIMDAANTTTVQAAEVMSGMANPFETKIEKKVLTKELDTDGLDL